MPFHDVAFSKSLILQSCTIYTVHQFTWTLYTSSPVQSTSVHLYNVHKFTCTQSTIHCTLVYLWTGVQCTFLVNNSSYLHCTQVHMDKLHKFTHILYIHQFTCTQSTSSPVYCTQGHTHSTTVHLYTLHHFTCAAQHITYSNLVLDLLASLKLQYSIFLSKDC